MFERVAPTWWQLKVGDDGRERVRVEALVDLVNSLGETLRREWATVDVVELSVSGGAAVARCGLRHETFDDDLSCADRRTVSETWM